MLLIIEGNQNKVKALAKELSLKCKRNGLKMTLKDSELKAVENSEKSIPRQKKPKVKK